MKALAICALAQSAISICASEDSTAVCPNVVTTEIIRTVMIRTDDNKTILYKYTYIYIQYTLTNHQTSDLSLQWHFIRSATIVTVVTEYNRLKSIVHWCHCHSNNDKKNSNVIYYVHTYIIYIYIWYIYINTHIISIQFCHDFIATVSSLPSQNSRLQQYPECSSCCALLGSRLGVTPNNERRIRADPSGRWHGTHLNWNGLCLCSYAYK